MSQKSEGRSSRFSPSSGEFSADYDPYHLRITALAREGREVEKRLNAQDEAMQESIKKLEDHQVEIFHRLNAIEQDSASKATKWKILIGAVALIVAPLFLSFINFILARLPKW